MSEKQGPWSHISGVFFDLETISSKADACIMSIGAVSFDIDKNVIERPFRVNLEIKDGVEKYGLRKSKQTMEWWKSQPSHILKRNLENAVPYEEGITQFVEYVNGIRPKVIWAWGSHFDVAIFNYSILKCFGEEAESPWVYNNICDARTIKTCFRDDIIRSTDLHDPLQDVKDQAQYLINFFRGITDES